jgi:hypothetical protein
MLAAVRRRLTFANVVSVIALFCALGGGAYAAVKLPSNSVGAKQIKKGAVTNAKLGPNAVTGANVKNGSLTAADINLATLPKVGSAAAADNAAHATGADNATNAVHATNADNATNAGTAQNISPPEDFHLVGASGEPAFAPGASNISAPTPLYSFEPAGFYKDKEGIVHLSGAVQSGSSGYIFTLPPGYRPADKKVVALTAYCGDCTVTDSNNDHTPSTSEAVLVYGGNIDPSVDGLVAFNTGVHRVMLDGLTFRAGY